MKKYLLFAFYSCYPNGGWDDFVKDSDNKDDLINYFNDSKFKLGQILNIETKEVKELSKYI